MRWGGYFGINAPISVVPLVVFDFQSQPWQVEALTSALEPLGSLKTPMGVKNSSLLPRDARLPMMVRTASDLFIVGLQALQELGLSGDDSDENPYPFPTLSTYLNRMEGDSTSGFFDISAELWSRAFKAISNTSVSKASVEYKRISISDQITYDAMTVELPVKKVLKTVNGEAPDANDLGRQINIEDYCNREGCFTFSGEPIQPTEQVVSICLDYDGNEYVTEYHSMIGRDNPCSEISNKSMLVAGIGKRIEGDVWDDAAGSSDFRVLRFKNLRTAYSITIGRLSWGAEDLAHAFGADCGNEGGCDGGCEGLRYKMQPDSGATSDYLTVGKDSLPLAELSHFNLAEPRQTKWTYLAAYADRLGVSSFDMLAPRRFTNITRNGARLQSTPNDECNMYADDFIQTVEKNHLYMEESLQTSYTATFYFFFQNAVRHKRMMASSSQSGTSAPYAFAGNVQLMNVQVSIPTANVIVSLVGYFLLLIGSVRIVLLAKRGKHVLQQRANAEIVAEGVMNVAKYPLLLLQMALEQLVGSQESLRFPLQDLRVQSVLLHHNAERKHVFHIGSEM